MKAEKFRYKTPCHGSPIRGVRLNDATDRSVDEMSEEELNETLAEVSKRKKKQ